jgi:hypothetical protein
MADHELPAGRPGGFDPAVFRAELRREAFAAGYRQSATACCPRETIPDSCSCLEGCTCLCADCDCGEDGAETEEWDG